MIVKVKELKAGQSGIIVNLDNKESNRLCCLGFSEGQRIKIISKGHVNIIEIMNSRYSIRDECLDCMEVILED